MSSPSELPDLSISASDLLLNLERAGGQLDVRTIGLHAVPPLSVEGVRRWAERHMAELTNAGLAVRVGDALALTQAGKEAVPAVKNIAALREITMAEAAMHPSPDDDEPD